MTHEPAFFFYRTDRDERPGCVFYRQYASGRREWMDDTEVSADSLAAKLAVYIARGYHVAEVMEGYKWTAKP